MKIWTTVSVLALAAATSAFGQEDVVELAPILVSANRGTETLVEEATVSVSVIGEEEIKERATVNTQVGEILGKTVPGFAVPTANLTEYGQTLRGRNFLTFIDGVPQTNTLNNDFRALSGIGLSAVEQIEVVRGTTAAYGFGGAGGLVNVITRKLKDGERFTELSFGLSFQDEEPGDSLSYRMQALTAQKAGRFDYLLSLAVKDTGSSFAATGERRPPDSFGTQGGTDDIRAYDLLVKGGVDLTESQRLEVSLSTYDYEQDSNWAGRVAGGSIAANTSATPSAGSLNTRTPGTENRSLSLKYLNEDVLGGGDGPAGLPQRPHQHLHPDRVPGF